MIYVHVPFCGSFCTYCDFYSEIACRGLDYEGYTEEICREIRGRVSEIESTLDVNTLYIGGGTPSVLPPMCLERIVKAVEEVTGGGFSEFTVEVNPEDIVERGPEYVRNLKELGVNRVSMGVQSLDDTILRWMNRRHDAARAKEAYGILRREGIHNVSVDIIFGISHLSEEALLNTVREIVSWGPEHISAYQLSIEDGSALAEMIETGRYTEASDEQCFKQYKLICRELKAAGYGHYEISNWARPGFRAVHNSAYWHRHPYVGVGPGAHSLLIRSGAPASGSWPEGTRPSQAELGPLPLEPRAASPFEPICRASGAPEQYSQVLCDDSVEDRNKCRQARAEVCETVVEPRRHPLERSVSGMPLGAVAKQRGTDSVSGLLSKQSRKWNSQILTGWTAESEMLSEEEIREEEIMLGLRTAEGWNGRCLSEDEWFVSDDIISDILAQS